LIKEPNDRKNTKLVVNPVDQICLYEQSGADHFRT